LPAAHGGRRAPNEAERKRGCAEERMAVGPVGA
jgi:hypothetical protein